jgi:membrane protein YqaA with SNARE-associated domain
MQELTFIHERPNRDKIRLLVTTIFLVVIIAALFGFIWYSLLQTSPTTRAFLSFVEEKFAQAEPEGIFFAELMSGIFFVPSPDELIYLYALSKESAVWIIFLTFNLGYLCAQTINYFIGYKFGAPILNFVSKKKLYAARRFNNKYGSLGIFLANVAPFVPTPLLVLGLGTTRYNFYKVILWSALGQGIKYAVITAVYIWTT